MRQPTAPVWVTQRHNRRLSPLSCCVDSSTHRQSFFLFDFFGGLCPSKIASAKTQSPWSRLLHCHGIIHRQSWITFTHKQSPFVTLAVLSWYNWFTNSRRFPRLSSRHGLLHSYSLDLTSFMAVTSKRSLHIETRLFFALLFYHGLVHTEVIILCVWPPWWPWPP